ncbi:MAG: surf-like protein [Phylliscum demangeonii]|nr:MAG: surf-like protein [Phylliscum demangeonii]
MPPPTLRYRTQGVAPARRPARRPARLHLHHRQRADPTAIPITAFALGTWQIVRLDRKTKQIAQLEDRLIRDPMPLPPRIDPDAVPGFDYRRVRVTGRLRHDQEMLLGPRVHEGANGFMVITPLERDDGDGASPVLVNRGWIAKKFERKADRSIGLPQGLVTVEGLLRSPWKKNMFTPDNVPLKGQWYFPDVAQMAAFTGCEPVWIEETTEPDFIMAAEKESKGIPLGRIAEVNLRNNHAQYIFTWYSLSLATTIMFWMVVRKPPSDIALKVRMSKEWRL